MADIEETQAYETGENGEPAPAPDGEADGAADDEGNDPASREGAAE